MNSKRWQLVAINYVVLMLALGSSAARATSQSREGWFGTYVGPVTSNPLADELAAAMGVNPADLINATFSNDTIAGAVVTGTVGFLSPTEGDTFVIISSGNAQPADFNDTAFPYYGGWIGTPDDFLSVDNENPSGVGSLGEDAYDLATLNLTLRAPSWAKSFSFNFRFMSEEYPEFVGTEFNDFFSCLLNGTNIAFDTEGKIININNNFFAPTITPVGTVFDGTTVLLTSKAPIIGGTTFEIDFIVGDVGDEIFDTAVFLDNFQFSTEKIEEPVTTTIWSSDSLGNEKNTFTVTESVYVTVTSTNETVTLYVVADKNVWNDGDPLTDVSGGAEQVTLGLGPGTQTIKIWASPLTVGSYDIIEDRGNDGFYNNATDGVDSIADVGFTVTPKVWSTDSLGNPKVEFQLSEEVFIAGSDFPLSTNVTIYIIPDGEDALPANAVANASTTTNSTGGLPVTSVWSPPLTLGEYDIWVDVNRNGAFDAGDMLNNQAFGIYGFLVIPEFGVETLLGLVVCFAALAAFLRSKRLHQIKTP